MMSGLIIKGTQKSSALTIAPRAQNQFAVFSRHQSTTTTGNASASAENISNVDAKDVVAPKADSYFIPGRRGFAPGFPPPKKWNPVPKPKKALKKPEDIPPPSKYQSKQYDPTKASAKAIYNQELTRMRYQYYKDSLAFELKKEEKSKRIQGQRLAEARKVESAAVAKKKEYIKNVLSDPYSAFNVMNNEGKTILSSISKKHAEVKTEKAKESETKAEAETEAAPQPVVPNNDFIQFANKKVLLQPFNKLKPPRVTITIPERENEIVKQVRAKRREEILQLEKKQRLDHLVNLYHSASSFVTYENMDSKIKEFFDNTTVMYSAWNNMINFDAEGNLLPIPHDIQERKIALRNVLDDTSGDKSEISLGGIIDYVEKHSQQKSE